MIILAMFGALLNSMGRWEGFLIWIVTNAVFFFHNLLIDEWEQALLFLFYFFIAINGIWQARKKYINEEVDEYENY